MGKGDQKSRKGKIIAGSYGKKRPRKSSSLIHVPVKVLDENDKKGPKEKVKKEVVKSAEKSDNLEISKKPKVEVKSKAEPKEEKPKAIKPKKTEE